MGGTFEGSAVTALAAVAVVAAPTTARADDSSDTGPAPVISRDGNCQILGGSNYAGRDNTVGSLNGNGETPGPGVSAPAVVSIDNLGLALFLFRQQGTDTFPQIIFARSSAFVPIDGPVTAVYAGLKRGRVTIAAAPGQPPTCSDDGILKCRVVPGHEGPQVEIR
jgi:hypothetical protein